MLDIFRCVKCFSNITIDSKEDTICPSCKTEYKAENGIIDFTMDANKEASKKEEIDHTASAFGWQWHNSDMGHNQGSKKYSHTLFFDRYGISEEELAELIKGKIIYDPAIGSGRVEHIFGRYAGEIYATDLSDAVFRAQEKLDSQFDHIHYFKGDLITNPFRDSSFDAVICHAILQHTGSSFKGLQSFERVLKTGGLLFFDVYRKAAPLRDFTDDFIRNLVSDLPPQEAWDKLIPLTELARDLYENNITVEGSIDELGIEAGDYNLQRFVYYKFIKTFWNENMSFEDNHMVVFDWYYPKIAERYTVEEVEAWMSQLNFDVIKLHALEGGIGVIAKKR